MRIPVKKKSNLGFLLWRFSDVAFNIGQISERNGEESSIMVTKDTLVEFF